MHRGRRRIGNEFGGHGCPPTLCPTERSQLLTSQCLGFFPLWHNRGVISFSAEHHAYVSIFPPLPFYLTLSLDLLIICLLTLNLGQTGTSVSVCFCHGGSIQSPTASQARVARFGAVGDSISGPEHLDALLKSYTASLVVPTDPITAAAPRAPKHRCLPIQLLSPSILRCRCASYSEKRTLRTVPPSSRLQNSEILHIRESDRTTSTSLIL